LEPKPDTPRHTGARSGEGRTPDVARQLKKQAPGTWFSGRSLQ
jgi:hypothetical protein